MKPITISILEDDALLVDLLVEVVEGAGMTVRHHSANARDFILGVIGQPPDVALIDLKLEDPRGAPAGNGAEVIADLAQRAPSVKTIAISGTKNPQDVERCVNAGASAFLFKHAINKTGVLEAVRAVMRGEKVFPFVSFPQPSSPPAAHPTILQTLTPKEQQVIRFVTSGADNLKIAVALDITERTVKAHLANLYRKLGCDNRTQLALKARELGVAPIVDV